jgi:hypothetical protein
MSDEPPSLAHARHFTLAQANAALETVKPLLQKLRDARDLLTDSEAHTLLADAAPTNGGGEAGRQVGEDEITHWHELDAGYRGRQPLE